MMALVHDNRTSLKRKITSIALGVGLLAIAGLLGAAFTRFSSRDSSVSPGEGRNREADAPLAMWPSSPRNSSTTRGRLDWGRSWRCSPRGPFRDHPWP